MDMVLLDWTRMGRVYCLAGVIYQGGDYRVVRPLHVRGRTAAERNTGWSPFLYDGRKRWDVFELIAPEPAESEPPHLEDVWVRDLRATGRTAGPAQRRAILQATLSLPGQLPFGVPLTLTRTSANLAPGSGTRSLASVLVSADQLRFSAALREGAPEPDFRVQLSAPGLDRRILPVKDHSLLLKAEEAAKDLDGSVQTLERIVRGMGERIVVRLGLTRAFAGAASHGERLCWLMADGFFSLTDPQP